MKSFIWTDADLDGVGSYLIFKWLLKADVPHDCTSIRRFASSFEPWWYTHEHKYDKIFICDLDVSNHPELVDHDKVVIFDHHTSHVQNKGVYKSATVKVEEYSSCTKLLYNKYKDVLNLTDAQRALVALIDDWDSGSEKELPVSLNRVFWGMNGNRIDKFVEAFEDGFTGFNEQHRNIIRLYEDNLENAIANNQFFLGDVEIGDTKYKVAGTITEFGIGDLCNYMLSKYKADFVFAVNTKYGSVSFRRSDDCTLSMNKLAGAIADGGGHDAAAGGKLTDEFQTFTKSLSLV